MSKIDSVTIGKTDINEETGERPSAPNESRKREKVCEDDDEEITDKKRSVLEISVILWKIQ